MSEITLELCIAQQQRIKEVEQAADEFGKELERESKDLGEPKEDLTFKLDVTWERTDIKFDIPELYKERAEMRFHAPKIYNKRQAIKFDVPTVEWAITTVGYYIKCRHLKCRKEPIRTKVPKIYRKRVDASFDIPEFKWDLTSIKFDIPKFRKKSITWSLHLPQFKLEEITIGGKPLYKRDIEEKNKALMKKAEAGQEHLQGEMADAIEGLNECIVNGLLEQREEIASQFESAIKAMEALRGTVVGQQGAVSSITGSDGNPLNIEAEIQKLGETREAALVEIDRQIQSFTKPDTELVSMLGVTDLSGLA